MESAQLRAQGALEYLLLIGGAVVVAVVVIFIMIGLAGTSGNAANQITTNAFAHILGEIDNKEPAGACDNDGVCDSDETYATCPTDCLCGNGEVNVGEVCDTALPGAACSSFELSGTGLVPCKGDCTGWENPYNYGCE